jgi:hypothetical protein
MLIHSTVKSMILNNRIFCRSISHVNQLTIAHQPEGELVMARSMILSGRGKHQHPPLLLIECPNLLFHQVRMLSNNGEMIY